MRPLRAGGGDSGALVEAPEYLYNPMTDSYDAPNWEAMGNKTVRCKNCGAEEVVDAAAMTAACPFCGSQYVMDENEVTEGILPETLQPLQGVQSQGRPTCSRAGPSPGSGRRAPSRKPGTLPGSCRASTSPFGPSTRICIPSTPARAAGTAPKPTPPPTRTDTPRPTPHRHRLVPHFGRRSPVL